MKQILIDAKIKGRGVVNFDDISQKYALKRLGIRDVIGNDNVKFCKKTFFKKEGEDAYDYNVKISSECIRHAIFGDVENLNPIVVRDDLIACTYFLSPIGICRGFMETIKDGTGYKRKSAVSVVDAIEDSGAKSEIEIGTKSGDKSETSMFFTEKIGDATYNFKGFIDFKQLMFIVADPIFDRLAIKPDWLTTGLAEKVMKNLYGEIANPRIGYFTSSSKYLTNTIAEFGILLNEELVVYLTKYVLTNIMNCCIKRSNAFASVTSLRIKFVENIIFNKMDDEEGWIDIKDISDIDKLDFHVYCPYQEASKEDFEKLETLNQEHNAAVAAKKEAKKTEKEAKALEKAAKKRKEKTNETLFET